MSAPNLKDICAAWDDALKRLHEATRKYEEASRAVSIARTAEAEALNRMNAVQKEMDKLDADLRSAMPRESHWARRSREAIVKEQQ